MKALEHDQRQVLSARSHTLIRLDGMAFHTYTRTLERPFDAAFAAEMDAVAAAVAAEAAGCVLAYVQSHETSLTLTDFAGPGTQPWFGGVAAKMVSVTAALASVVLAERRPGTRRPLFDSRAFTLPTRDDVAAYFTWRQRDCVKNSVAMAGQSRYSHASLRGVHTDAVRERLRADGHPWEELPAGFRLGRLVQRELREEPVTFTHRRTMEVSTVLAQRTHWVAQPAPQFGSGEDDQPLLAVPHPFSSETG